MQDTCDPKECEFYKFLKFKNPTQCMNYQESWWQPDNKGNSILIKDCAPRRTFIMIQDLHNRLVGVQKAQEEQRNENVWVQVVAEILGKNSGIDLEDFVKERQSLQNIRTLKITK